MSKINFCVSDTTSRDDVILWIVDAAYAQMQHVYQNSVPIKFQITNSLDPEADLNVFLQNMPTQAVDVEGFDLVFYFNAGEPLIVATETIRKDLELPDRYLMSNSFLTDDHAFAKKIVGFVYQNQNCLGPWTRYFYPHFFENHDTADTTRDHNIIFINGQNRTWRQYFMDLLHEICGDLPMHDSLGSLISKTKDSFFESPEDTVFRHTVNVTYENEIMHRGSNTFWNDPVECGIDGKFGTYAKGFSILPLYYQYTMVIFPETTWQNDEVCFNEKIAKCCYSGSIPWPVGGSNLHRLYNEFGIQTAWNLLPQELQEFDREKNHFVRHKRTIEAMAWLKNNWHLTQTPLAQQIVSENKVQFLCGLPKMVTTGIKRFNSILREKLHVKNSCSLRSDLL